MDLNGLFLKLGGGLILCSNLLLSLNEQTTISTSPSTEARAKSNKTLSRASLGHIMPKFMPNVIVALSLN